MRTVHLHPAEPPVPRGASVRLSVIDRAVEERVPVILAYRTTLDPTRLQQSLVRSLTDCPEFAGRLCRRGFSYHVRWPGAGVRFQVQSGPRLDTLLDDLPRCVDRLVEDFEATLTMRMGSTLCRVRVTQCAGGGTVLGVVSHHSVCDLAGIAAWLEIWACHARGAPRESVLRHADRERRLREVLPSVTGRGQPLVRDLAPAELGPVLRAVSTRGRVHLPVGLYFAPDELRGFSEELSGDLGRRVTQNDAITAVIAQALYEAYATDERYDLAMVADLRKRLGFASQEFGNLITWVNTTVDHGRSAADIARELRAHLDELGPAHVDYLATERHFRAIDDRWTISRPVPTVLPRIGSSMFVTNWAALAKPLDFGGGRPLLTSVGRFSYCDGVVVLLPGPEGVGMEVRFRLPRPVWRRFVGDRARLSRLHRHRPRGGGAPFAFML